MNIYDLSAKELELKSMLFCLDPEDQEDAERIALIERQLDALSGSKERKIMWRVRVRQEIKAIRDAKKERHDHTAKGLKIADNALARADKNLADAMELLGVEKVQDEEFSVSYKLSGATAKVIGLDDYDVRHLPMDCYDTIPETYKPKLNAIKALLKTTDIDGLELVSGKTLRIS